MQEGLTMDKSHTFTHRYLARFIIEAETPIAVGSGERDVMTDRLVATDVNGLPYIPGTALAGVLKNAVQLVNEDNIFGFQKGNDGQGSRLILSSAQMVGKAGIVIDGLQTIDFKDEFYANFQNLPIRQHVRISHKGASEQGGKFDEQVVYKGTRFCFEMELVGKESDKESWEKLIAEFSSPAFRLGGGTRKGFGAITIVEIKNVVLDLRDEEDLNRYLKKTTELNDPFWKAIENKNQSPGQTNWIQYELTLTPDDFFLFGSGFGNEDGSADMSYVTETVIKWENKEGRFSKEEVLIPATSVKGALAHRTAFYFNKAKNVFADKVPNINDHIGENNLAVRALFGYAANDDEGQRGNVMFSDIYSERDFNKKLLNHVAIDRFTGGVVDGALFSEEVIATQEKFKFIVHIKEGLNEEFVSAFESALHDLCTGMLPLGGGTMRGHGSFNGNWTIKNGGKTNEK